CRAPGIGVSRLSSLPQPYHAPRWAGICSPLVHNRGNGGNAPAHPRRAGAGRELLFGSSGRNRLEEEVTSSAEFDVVVAGGGLAGCATALTLRQVATG